MAFYFDVTKGFEEEGPLNQEPSGAQFLDKVWNLCSSPDEGSIKWATGTIERCLGFVWDGGANLGHTESLNEAIGLLDYILQTIEETRFDVLSGQVRATSTGILLAVWLVVLETTQQVVQRHCTDECFRADIARHLVSRLRFEKACVGTLLSSASARPLKKGKHVRLCTTNVTGAGSLRNALEANEFVDCDIVFVQEHRLVDQEQILSLRRFCDRFGFRSLVRPARKTTKSTSGGVAMLFAPWVSMAEVGDLQTDWYQLCECRVGGLPFMIANLYGSQDVDLNLQRVTKLVEGLHTSDQQWIIGGDFNIPIFRTREVASVCKWPCKVVGTGPNDVTCTCAGGSHIDYFMMSDVLQQLTGECCTRDSLLATHRPVSVCLENFTAKTKVNTIRISKGVAGRPVFGPAPEPPTFRVAQVTREIVELAKTVDRRVGQKSDRRKLDLLWERVREVFKPWVAGTFGTEDPMHENEVSRTSLFKACKSSQFQKTLSDLENKAREVTQVYRRMCECKAASIRLDPHAGTKFKEAVARQTKGSISKVTQKMCEFVQTLDELQVQKWSLENLPSIAGWRDKLHRKIVKVRQDHWNKLLKDQVGKGTRLGFQIAKPALGINYGMIKESASNAVQDQLSHEEATWSKYWTRDQPEDDSFDREAPLAGRLEVDQVKEAAKRFKKQTSTVDGMHPAMFAFMDEDMVQMFTAAWELFDRGGMWPTREEIVPIRLLAKPSGGLRPIALYRTNFRIMAACFRDKARAWMSSIPEVGLNCRPGRKVTDTTYRLQLREGLRINGCKVDVKGAERPHSAEILADLTKAYDCVDRRRLIEEARHFKYPQDLLHLSLTSYRWSRRLVCGKMASGPVEPTTGILAGSMAAPFEMALYTLRPLVRLGEKFPAAQVTMHVDDLSVTSHGWTARAVSAEIEKVTVWIFHEFREASLEVALQKTFFLGSSEEVERNAEALLHKKRGGSVLITQWAIGRRETFLGQG